MKEFFHHDKNLTDDKIAESLLETELEINDIFSGLIMTEKTAVFIDVNNLYKRSRAEGFVLDYTKVSKLVSSRCLLEHFCVVSAINVDDPSMLAWIEKCKEDGITPITKPVRQYVDDYDGGIKFKGNMDVELTIEIMKLYENYDHIVIGTCDGDFVALVNHLKNNAAKKVSVMGISNYRRKGMSEDLVNSAENFYDLRLIRNSVSKLPSDE